MQSALLARVREVIAVEPSLGYRSVHAMLKSEPEFCEVGLKKVKEIVRVVRDKSMQEDLGPRGIEEHLLGEASEVCLEACVTEIDAVPSAASSDVRVRVNTMSGLDFHVVVPQNVTYDELQRHIETESGLDMDSYNIVHGTGVIDATLLAPLTGAPQDVCLQLVHDGWGTTELEIQKNSSSSQSHKVVEQFFPRQEPEVFEVTTPADGEVPAPFKTLRSCGFPREVRPFFEEMTMTTPRALQSYCWSVAAAGRDLRCVASFGSGKLLAWLLPAVLKIRFSPKVSENPTVVAIFPTREHCANAHGAYEQSLIARFGVKSCCLIGGVSLSSQRTSLASGVELVMCTPGRLLDLVNRKFLHVDSCEYLVLEDVDTMLEYGFEPHLHELAEILPGTRRTACFTEHDNDDVQRVCAKFVMEPVHLTIKRC